MSLSSLFCLSIIIDLRFWNNNGKRKRQPICQLPIIFVMMRLLKPFYDKHKNIRIISRTCLHVYLFRIHLFTVCKYWSKVLKKFPYFRSGAERSGLFCVALYIAQQIMTQQKVDIFSAVKHVRLYRPQCIANMVRFFSLFYAFGKGLSTSGTNTSFLFFYYFRSSTSSCTSLHRNTSHVRIKKFLMNFELHHSFMADNSTDLFQHNGGFKWMCDLT